MINKDTPIHQMQSGKYKYINCTGKYIKIPHIKELPADWYDPAEDAYYEWLLAVMQGKERGNFDGTRTTGYTKRDS